jgi:hypothetical protein
LFNKIIEFYRDFQDISRDEPAGKVALDFMKDIEEEKSFMGASPHVMGLGRKP